MAAIKSPDGVTVTLDAVNRKLRLNWPENQSTEFHYVWLRHHARCPDGLPNDTSIKIDLVPDDPTSLVISDYNITDKSLEISWGDNDLKTTHPLGALVSVRYDQSSRKRRKSTPILWPLDTESSIPCYPCSDLDAQHLFSRLDCRSETSALRESIMSLSYPAQSQRSLSDSVLCIEITMAKSLM